MRRFTVLHLDGELGLRGGERQLLSLVGALAARGHRGVVCCREGGELAAEARRRGLEAATFPLRGELDFLSVVRLVALARREGAVVHAHTGHTCGTAALVALAGVPVVMHRRVDFAVSPLSARWKYGLAGKVVAVSRAIGTLLERAGLPASKLAVVPDAVPVTVEEARWAGHDALPYRSAAPGEREALRAALAREFAIPPDAPLVGNLAALVPHKDHDTLVAAAVIVCLKRPDARFLIAGSGPEEARLRESLSRMGLKDKVVLAGQRADGAALLRAFDAYCQSSWGEGMGSVLLEAQASAVPIAATSAGGIPEVVEDGATGLLAPPRDPEALAGAILRLLDDPALGRRLAAEALRRLPAFGWAAAAEKMERVYEAVA
ncbi:MAG: glycosyltransferase [Elusimicrobiota bacterium]|nr:glycosyltransferase [Elusimicrobiota bacterium]